jgi:hypothetical protein
MGGFRVGWSGVNETIKRYYFYLLCNKSESRDVGVNKAIYYFYLLFRKSESQFLGLCKTSTNLCRDTLFVE